MSANKIVGKSESVKDMIPQIEKSLLHSSRGPSYLNAFNLLGCASDSVESCIPNSITWKRKVASSWDSLRQIFVPLSEPCIESENFVLVWLEALSFVKQCQIGLTLLEGQNGVESTLRLIQVAYPQKTIIYLIEGLDKYYNLRKAHFSHGLNQQVTARLERGYSSLLESSPASTTRSKTSKPLKEDYSSLPDRAVVEEACCWLQLFQGIKIMMSKNEEETISYLTAFTQEMSQLPFYK